MDQTLEAFVAHLQAQDVSQHTVKAYQRDVCAFFKWLAKQVGQDTPPVEVIAFDVQKYRDHLVDLGRKPATVNRRLAGLRAFFAWMVAWGQMASNPVGDVKGVKQTWKVPKALAFNGKRAAKVFYDRRRVDYGRQAELIGETVVFVFPSTSGMARRYWDESYWRDLAGFVQK